MTRIVIFAEVPGFYSAIERRDGMDPRPVIVGGDPRRRGLVQDASPEAEALGVCEGMPVLEALRLCPRARCVRTDVPRYREVSRRLFACLRQGIDRLEPFGLGAAYFDGAGASESPEAIATALRDAVRERLNLPLRVGIAAGKFMARLAAQESPVQADGGGSRRIRSGGETDFLHPLPASRIDGVGQKTAASLAELGATTIGEVVSLGRDRLEDVFGSHGSRIFALASGADDGPVRAARHPQSLSREVTVRGEALDLGVLGERLQDIARHLETELAMQGLLAAKISLKVRYVDGVTTTRSQTQSAPVGAAAAIRDLASGLLARTQAGSRPVRTLGIQLAKLAPAAESGRQLDLFDPPS